MPAFSHKMRIFAKYLEMKNYYSFFSLLLCWQAAAARKIHSPWKEALKDFLQTLY